MSRIPFDLLSVFAQAVWNVVGEELIIIKKKEVRNKEVRNKDALLKKRRPGEKFWEATMFEDYLNIHDVKEIRARSLIYFGCGAISKMADIAKGLKARGADRVLIVSSKSAYKTSGAWEPTKKALDEGGIAWTLYDQVTPNPDTDSIDAATAMARQFGAKGIIGIGGGSPIDVAKSVAILMEYPDQTAETLYEWKFQAEKALPIVAINLTHGTGTEADRFAVASIESKHYKPAIAGEPLYPLWSIDDPELMLTMPKEQIMATTVDAVNHVVEASTSKVTNPFAVTLARETIALAVKYLPIAMADPKDLTARYHLAYGALLGGISFDNGFLHYTHALEHPLSGMKPKVIHGIGLGILLPAVIRNIYPACGNVLADILAPMVPDLTGGRSESDRAADGVEKWLSGVGIDRKLSDEGFTESDLDHLTDLVFETPSLAVLLSVAPTEATREAVSKIYRDSFTRS